jgi:hypothetical protein
MQASQGEPWMGVATATLQITLWMPPRPAPAAGLSVADKLQCHGVGRIDQTQQRDIEVAHGYWQDYQKRTGKHSVPRG